MEVINLRKKVLFYMFNLAGGGAERTIVNIVNNMDNSKFEVVLVIGSKSNNDYLNLVNKNIKIIYLQSYRHRQSLLKLSKTIRKEKPDLLFSTLNKNNIILIISKLLAFKRIPTIVREANNRTQAGRVSRINKLFTFILYNYFSDKVISLSKGVKDDLVKNFNIKKNKIEVIYNPVDLKNINKLKKEKVCALDLATDEKLIIAVGKLGEQKDYSTLFRAFQVVSNNMKVKLIILGKGPEENKLKALCQDLVIEKKVLFMGFKDNPYKYIRKADVFVLTSKWEGFGHVIVEAMAVGTPVIATDCNSGPAEIIEDDKYGILVPVKNHETIAEKIIELLKDEKRRKNYIELGYKRSKDFNAVNIVKQYESIFSSLNKE